MLEVIAFKNFVHFKTKTVISLKGQAGNPTDNHFLNIFVGANFCGKSTVIELIRRCMSEKINASETISCDENPIAYAFCTFGLDSNKRIISGIIKNLETKENFKIICSSDTPDSIVFSSRDSRDFYRLQLTGIFNVLNNIATENDDSTVQQFLKNIEGARQDQNKVPEEDAESKWRSISEKFVTTFPLRGIGSLQWSESKKIAKDQRDNNYEAACERAEIISKLLSKDQQQFINADEEKRIFKYLTDSEDFEFEKTDNTAIIVKHNGKQFPLLKISEGIFEAKSTSLLLAHTQFQTLCLEDPDRGMHPQMIERLRTVLYDISIKKTIIVVTHSPYFIDSMTIDKTHVFFRTKDEPSFRSVLNIGQSEELSKVTDLETKRTLLFATRVLLVEGQTDREVVQGILTENKYKKDNQSQEGFANGSTHQIISVGGKSNAARVRRFCNYINLPCLCLLDLDAAFKFDIEPIKQFEGFNDELQSMFHDTLKNTKTEFEKFFKKLESKLNLFIWKDGALEDAILSSTGCNAEIAEALGITPDKLNSARLKNILKEPIDGDKRKRFYTKLMKVDEIKRFITFIENDIRPSNPTVAGVDTQ